jgi:probable F420-dependent oxidoreductase
VALPGAATAADAQVLGWKIEAAGFDTAWVLDVRRDPFLISAAALAATSRIGVGTNVAVAFARSPAVTAAAAWDLSAWSGGRFILGLGSQVGGTLENRFGVTADHPAPRMRDYVQAVRACWEAYARGHGGYQGTFYSIRQPVFQPGGDAGIEPPPIYLAAVNPLMARVAGECADGVAAHPFTTAAYVEEVLKPAVHAGAAASGRPPPPILLQLVVAPDRETAVRQMTAYAVPAYRRVLDHAGLGSVADAILAANRDGRRSEARRLLDEHALDRLGVIVGDDIDESVRKWSTLADRLSLSVPWYGMPADAQLLAVSELIEQAATG